MHLAQAELPIAIELLHGACATAPDGRIVLCLIERRTIEQLREAQPDLSSLCPADIPDFLDQSLAPRSFELLTGSYEPIAMTRQRTMHHRLAALLCVLAACVVSIGLIRRASAMRKAAEAWQHAAHRALTHDSHTTTLAALESRAEVASLLKPTMTQHLSRDDAIRTLASFLAAVTPTDESVAPPTLHSVRVTPSSVDARLTPAEARAFLASLRDIDSWTLAAPKLSARNATSQLELRWTKGDVP